MTGEPTDPADPILRIRDLAVQFPIRKRGMFARRTGWLHAVNGVDLDVRPGEVLGLVGESGCGKTTLGRCMVGSQRPFAGQVHYRTPDGSEIELTGLTARQRQAFQHQIRVIFQDPFSSLNPRMTILQIVGDPLQASGIASGKDLERRVGDMLSRVGLSPGHMHRYPHAFSGGQRQRVNIARALITGPRVVIADEAVSALDVSVRAQVLNLLRDLQDELELTYVFISHDMSVVESICDRVAVMYLGRVVEVADTADLYRSPQHPYTEALLSAVPRPDPRLRDQGRRILLSDNFPDPADPPDGCFFHTRCPYADGSACSEVRPELEPGGDQHTVACHHHERLQLTGVVDPGSTVDPPPDSGPAAGPADPEEARIARR